MTVEAYDDVVPGRGQRQVEPGTGRAGRVGHQTHPVVLRGQLGGDLVGAVGRGAQREHHLEGAGVVLAEHGGDRVAQVLLLVEHRHHDGDPR